MPEFLIHGVNIDFPYEPYDVQKKYIETIVDCLRKGKFAVLESPTGTGKTLSLLCATLGWLEHKRLNPDSLERLYLEGEVHPDGEEPERITGWENSIRHRIIYASRTHSQLSQVMKELSKTAYRNMKTAILSSRDQTCINPTVKTEELLSVKNSMCKMLMKKKQCRFGAKVEKNSQNSNFMQGVVDIEDLVKKCEKEGCCPFFLSRDSQAHADITFMPYNYLFDRNIRASLGIKLANTIVILDEAHNINKVCEEAESVSISSQDIAVGIAFITEEMERMNTSVFYDSGEENAIPEYGPEDLMFVKYSLMSLETMFEKLVTEELHAVNNKTYLGSKIFDFLMLGQLSESNNQRLVEILNQVHDTCSIRSEAWQPSFPNKVLTIDKIARSIGTIFNSKKFTCSDIPNIDAAFRTYLCIETPNHPNKPSAKIVTLNFWCLNAGYGMASLYGNGIHSLIVTSGTLSPLHLTASELAINSRCCILENSHVVLKSQVLVTPVPTGPRNITLLSNFQTRGDKRYWEELGLTVMNFIRIIPGGVLLFFPSYAAMNTGVDTWKESGLWNKLMNIKPLFLEPRKKVGVDNIIADYMKCITDKKGGVLIGVCRGKFSEGIDFSDDACRGVIITGLPYPPFMDPKVIAKKLFCDQRRSCFDISGQTWYEYEALRAVNQAIGRVIRHSRDYGCILLCDERFGSQRTLKHLSKWLQDKICLSRNIGEGVKMVRNFFRALENGPFNQVTQHSTSQLCSAPFPSNCASRCDTAVVSTQPTLALPSSSCSSTFSVDQFVSDSFSHAQAVGKKERTAMHLVASTSSSSAEVIGPPPPKKTLSYSMELLTKMAIPPVITPAKKRLQCNNLALDEDMKTPIYNENSEALYPKIRAVLTSAKNIFDDETYCTYRDIFKRMEYTNNTPQALAAMKDMFPPNDPTLRDFFRDSSVFFEFKADRRVLYNAYKEMYYP